MGSPYIGEIRMFAGNFAPEGWAYCDGSPQDISQNTALYSLLQTTYGGSASQFNLPDLQGRVPVGMGTLSGGGTVFGLGQSGGTETVTLSVAQMPGHGHIFAASSNNGSQPQPQNAFPAKISSGFMYTTFSAGSQMNANAVTFAGGTQPHDNMMPTLTVSFIISLYGVMPSAT